jgi:ribosomal protein S18 acetylase RimI-like enzyme
MIIRAMRSSDLDFAAGCTAAEGWASETRQEFEGFLAHDPGGCLVAENEGRQVGICIATHYGECGFVGELIVAPDMRGHGIGRQLLERAIEYLRGRGARNILLEGDPPAVPLYERAGFRTVCRSTRFVGALQAAPHVHARSMRAQDMDAVAAQDREAFGADRRFFLECSLALYPEFAKVVERRGKIAGFIMGRRGNGLVSAGPWIVQPGLERPADLLESLAAEAAGIKLRVGVLETNTEAVATCRRLGLAEQPDAPWRMVLGPSGRLGLSRLAYAIGSAAKG